MRRRSSWPKFRQAPLKILLFQLIAQGRTGSPRGPGGVDPPAQPAAVASGGKAPPATAAAMAASLSAVSMPQRVYQAGS